MKTHDEHQGSGMIRQGDVLLKPAKAIPKKAAAMPADSIGRVVLAEGEATGHAHALPFGGAVMFCDDGIGSGRRYLDVKEAAALSHEHVDGRQADHDRHIVPPGVFRVIRQREYDDVEARRVQD